MKEHLKRNQKRIEDMPQVYLFLVDLEKRINLHLSLEK